ncbi:MAG: 8-oxo-dGTP diphosphatase [Blastochloris sp.]|nr:8-oxo-dGTP diphosphatase [Blastochloris sp.]
MTNPCSDSITVDWLTWQPTELAVLCFVVENSRILLIEKKRGLGAGKVNAPGGKIKLGETPLEAAIRETQEEVGVIPIGLTEAGVLRFQFKDGYALHCTVFKAKSFQGVLIETPEATPFIVGTDEIPFERMWADDSHWVKYLLSGDYFSGAFLFDEDRMLTNEVKV